MSKKNFANWRISFANLEQAAKNDVNRLKEWASALPDIPTTGWIYPVESGNLGSVV
jgi:hypothetical protein